MHQKTRGVLLALVCGTLALSACQGWPKSPTIYNPSPAAPTRTPSIQTPTPIILSPVPVTASPTLPLTETIIPITSTVEITPTVETATAEASPTSTSVPQAIKADVLGCDTGLDIAHGMGEVTNAYVTISNPTSNELLDLCATLSGLDEGRPHPDKTKCVPTLATGYQVLFKLTVDTTYTKDTPIQIDITSSGNLLLRVGEAACKDVSVLVPSVANIGIPQPIP